MGDIRRTRKMKTEDIKSVILKVRVTAKEREQVRALAEKQGVTMSRMILRAIGIEKE